MTRRLVLSYLGMALLILVVLEVPLANLAQRHERDQSASQAAREATGLAAVASEDVEHGRASDLGAIVARYQSSTGGEVAIVDPAGAVIAASSNESTREATSDQRELVQDALAGHSVSTFTSDEGRPWAAAAVPVTAGEQPQGAVLLGLPAAATEDRIHGIWMALGAFGLAVLVLTALVGLALARSVAQPLARLQGAVDRLGEGDLGARARDDVGPPQVRSLAGQFNHMAVRLSELVDAQSRFVADASHQLRSPLTALRLRLENLEAGAGPAAAPGMAAAGREVQRLSRIVDGLLTLSRAAGDEPERRPVDVEAVIEERCDAWSALAAERQVELVPEARRGRRTTALLVPGDLDQILDNLLANAVEASPEGGRIAVRLVPTEAARIELHVVDTGPGMSADERHRAFDRFWQGDGANHGHSGLGLAIVRQLATRNDASVELRQAQPTGVDAVLRLVATTDRHPAARAPAG